MRMYSIKGFTLVELMVSLTLGLIIMLSAMQLLLTNQISFNLQSGMGNVQENGRFALDYINNSVRSAEYSQNTSNPTVGIITIQSELPGLPNNTLVTRNDLTSLGKGMSDQLVTRMWVSPTMIASNFRDCEGNAVAAQGFVVTRYFVRTDPVTGSNAALACDSGYYAVGAATVSNYGDDGVVLLSTIDSFQIQLGVSAFPIPPLGQRVPIRYLTAQAYTNIVAASRPIVVSLRMALLVRSNEKVSTGFSATIPDVRVLEKTIVGSDLNDKFVHRVFNSTLALRNAM